MLILGRLKPSFMIIGAQKAGTTSLHNYLVQHNDILAPKKKEIHFFDSNKPLDINNYHLNFPYKFSSKKKSFESTPRYLYYPNTAKRLKKYNPNLKFIIVLRDPIERAYSAWNMYRQMIKLPQKKAFFITNEKLNENEKIATFFLKKDFPSFLEWINFEINLSSVEQKTLIEPSIVRRGYYKEQILNFLDYFDINQFMFINSKELLDDTSVVLKDVFNFLNLKSIDLDLLDLSIAHKRVYTKEIDLTAKEILKKHYDEKNKGLEELIGKKFNWN